MKITLHYSAILKIDNLKNESSIDIESGTTVSDLLTMCNVKEEHQKYIRIYVNGKKNILSYILQENDQLFLALPIGGG